MSKKRAFYNLAHEMGILSPIVKYEKRSKEYHICISIPAEDGVGVIDAVIGGYHALADAKETLEADIQAFLLRYPTALEKVTDRYHIVTLNEGEQSQDDTAHKIRQFLEALQRENHQYYQDDAVAILAKQTAQYIADLEAERPPNMAKGTYKSQLPEQPKKAIEWEQPQARQHPVYTFEFDCQYCGGHFILERHSPRQPQHCGGESCAAEHRRKLARERKRRQRERERLSRNNTIS
ncbi:MAG: hypothetical protein AAFQ52_15130 [Chloroflexota bacterium]